MNLITILSITFMLNGMPQQTNLLSPSVDSCLSDMYVSEAIIRYMGGTNIQTQCIIKQQ